MITIINDIFRFISKNKKGLVLSVILAFFTLICNAQNWDIDLLKEINLHRNRSLDPLFRFITDSAPIIAYTVPVVLCLLSFFQKNKRLKIKSIYIVCATLLALVIEKSVKHFVNRPRPFITYTFIQKVTSAGSPSFPSGHTSDAFTLAVSLSLAFPKWYVILPSFVWAMAVGYSRMDLGVHYPTDIMGSIVIACLSSLLCFIIFKRKEKETLLSGDINIEKNKY
jgi:undecaprenyl-diphosphatase